MKVVVKYWRGTSRCEGIAHTYRGALRIAARNQNKFDAKFYDAAGRELCDTGFGLAYPEPDEHGRIVCVV